MRSVVRFKLTLMFLVTDYVPWIDRQWEFVDDVSLCNKMVVSVVVVKRYRKLMIAPGWGRPRRRRMVRRRRAVGSSTDETSPFALPPGACRLCGGPQRISARKTSFRVGVATNPDVLYHIAVSVNALKSAEDQLSRVRPYIFVFDHRASPCRRQRSFNELFDSFTVCTQITWARGEGAKERCFFFHKARRPTRHAASIVCRILGC